MTRLLQTIIEAEGEISSNLCLNPYVACRKDAVGVSNVTMQSSIVTGSEIGLAGHGSIPYKGERELGP